ncbi:TetR/AcrR family transcriptional regulator [Streptosporangium longisporum]|uniref:TetR/AcrR family transcriptional regulator n=1 Tax=Streptosporangium longisporum TaxID=46187 RepID=UPI0031F18473
MARRRLDVADRREELLAAARAAFARWPYETVTVAAIARAADASEALVYRYFSGKEELYLETVRAGVRDLLSRQQDLADRLPPGTPPAERLAASVRLYLDFVSEQPAGWAGLLRPGAIPEAAALQEGARDRFADMLRAATGAGPGSPSDYAFRGYLGFCDAVCLAWVEAGRPEEDREHLVQAAVGALEGALRRVGETGRAVS